MARFRTLDLSTDAQQTLLEARTHHPRPAVRERAAALLQIAAGQTPYHVARAGLLPPRDPDTVDAWLDRYQRDGLASLLGYRHGGARRRGLF